MCFLFGPGIPVLFIIGFIEILIIYIIDKYSVAKLYRLPVRYSIDITNICISGLIKKPILYSLFGFWMYSNKLAFYPMNTNVESEFQL